MTSHAESLMSHSAKLYKKPIKLRVKLNFPRLTSLRERSINCSQWSACSYIRHVSDVFLLERFFLRRVDLHEYSNIKPHTHLSRLVQVKRTTKLATFCS